MKLGCSYFGNRILKHLKTDLEELRECGCNLVVHTFNENDLMFYNKTICEMVEMTREMGFEVYIDPWGVGKVFGGESFSNFVMQNTDAMQMVSDGRPGGCACPNHPKFRAFMREWIDAAVHTGAETLFWDEPHFYLPGWIGGRPNTWGCVCPVCRKKFEETFNKPFPEQENEDINKFREDCIYEFLAELIAYTNSKGRRNALCVLPHRDSNHGTANWERMASIPHLQVFGTDPYWYIFKEGLDYVERATKDVQEICAAKGLESQVWLQGFKVPGGREAEMADAIDIMLKHGVTNIAVWGFLACSHISWIRPDNPELAWETIKNKFREVRNQHP
ncbi:MAG: hypothetical protein K1X53_17850 [Candidatus Sumerlaeaceae bacterium]|nr:hypothetical protein [Candidatus Sumerlaeaceae bacterium]